MKSIAIAVAVLAGAACSASDAEDAGSDAPTCYDVLVSTQATGRTRSICTNHTQNGWACVKGQDGSWECKCVYLRGEKAGVTFEILCGKQCNRYAIDNAPCCDPADPGGDVDNWNCSQS